MHLTGEPGAEPGGVRQRIVGPVGLPVLNLGGFTGDRGAKGPHDVIRGTRRLGGRRPFPEIRVSRKGRLPARDVASDHVRARSRDRSQAGVAGWDVLRHGRGELEGELVKKVGVRRGEPEGHRAAGVVGYDAAIKVAELSRRARRGARNPVEERCSCLVEI